VTVDWQTEWGNSAWWLLRTFACTLLVFGAVAWCLARKTVWGRQFWTLSGPFFVRQWKPLAGLALIVLFTLWGVRMTVLFSMWYNTMYTSLQTLDEAIFWFAIRLVALLGLIDLGRELLEYYVQKGFIIHWREWLNGHLLELWLKKQSYLRAQYLPDALENPDQRIQHDITAFTQASLSLSMGMVKAVVATFAYTLLLWDLSGTLELFGIDIPRAMVFTVFVYVIIATVFAVRIGRPLISLNFLSERFAADYRYALMRVREYAESIAFYRGEQAERLQLQQRFTRMIDNTWAIVRRSMLLLGFNSTVSQTAGFLPFMVQAKRFFAKDITLGDLIQTSRVFSHLLNNLSFFRNIYDDFAAYRATLERLNGFTQAMQQAGALPAPNVYSTGTHLILRDVHIFKPDGSALIQGLNLELAPGQTLLIRGPSGSGKTTLLRTIAGLWPYSQGEIVRPNESTLFLSQQPYLPLGSLREALHYPATPTTDIADAKDILQAIQLGHLADRLDNIADWGHILSLGEQQQLALGRLLLARPTVAFLDEATSAMDETREDTLYRLLRERLPDTLFISVGHRSTLRVHHSRELLLTGQGGG